MIKIENYKILASYGPSYRIPHILTVSLDIQLKLIFYSRGAVGLFRAHYSRIIHLNLVGRYGVSVIEIQKLKFGREWPRNIMLCFLMLYKSVFGICQYPNGSFFLKLVVSVR